MKGPMNQGLSVSPSIPLYICSSSFLGIGALVFSETQHGVRGQCVVLHDRGGFFDFFAINGGMGQKQGFLNLLENLVIDFFLNLVYKGSVYYLGYSWTNPVLGTNLVPEIWVKMLSANQQDF